MASIGLPLSLSRKRPTASKFSSVKPSGLMTPWQVMQPPAWSAASRARGWSGRMQVGRQRRRPPPAAAAAPRRARRGPGTRRDGSASSRRVGERRHQVRVRQHAGPLFRVQLHLLERRRRPAGRRRRTSPAGRSGTHRPPAAAAGSPSLRRQTTSSRNRSSDVRRSATMAASKPGNRFASLARSGG